MKFLFHKKNYKKLVGFSLIEVLVSVVLFTIIIVSTTEVFRLVVVGQRKAVASQNVQESLKYFLEATSKEVRMAKKKEGFCGSYPLFSSLPADQVYMLVEAPNGQGNALIFRNYYDECVVYYLGNNSFAGRFLVRRNNLEAPISPLKVNLSELNFSMVNYDFSLPISRPLVVMKIAATAYTGDIGEATYHELADIKMQTALTSRFYR